MICENESNYHSNKAAIAIIKKYKNRITITANRQKKMKVLFSFKVKAVLPDKSPAAGVPVEVCAAGKCKNMTTADDGLFTAVVSSENTNRVFVSWVVLDFCFFLPFCYVSCFLGGWTWV